MFAIEVFICCQKMFLLTQMASVVTKKSIIHFYKIFVMCRGKYFSLLKHYCTKCEINTVNQQHTNFNIGINILTK